MLIRNLFSVLRPALAQNHDQISSNTLSLFGRFCTKVLTESEYDLCSEATLSTLSGYLETLPELVDTDPSFDVSYSMGVLTISISSTCGTYVINKQTPNKQLWLSSPISGPKRYDLNTSGKWVYKHDGMSIHELLENEFRSIYNTEVIKLTSLQT